MTALLPQTARIPDHLAAFVDGLSLAELCAARLDGEVYALDDGFASIADPPPLVTTES
ncbi:hypothetical protein [Subtercola endophyticus]|uniref:hypothetical protein n=1 Tax=Subtercola endophyticus TaxID=2895559 RepID=UPI001E2F71A5|nr:hypothetical protein [Subtercola endophyticus]UFS60273.1 hypothetical protein LQ955_05855 [Subtercola endophyticus]